MNAYEWKHSGSTITSNIKRLFFGDLFNNSVSTLTTFCYLTTLSVSRPYTVDDSMMREYGTVGGMRISLLTTMSSNRITVEIYIENTSGTWPGDKLNLIAVYKDTAYQTHGAINTPNTSSELQAFSFFLTYIMHT